MSLFGSRFGALLLCWLLLPWGAAAALWTQVEGSTCGMACCRRTGRCCCHKRNGVEDSVRPAWRAQGRCPDGCSLTRAMRGGATGLVPARAEEQSIRTEAAVAHRTQTPVWNCFRLARRGRAPPSV
jgi:hypothetical protein